MKTNTSTITRAGASIHIAAPFDTVREAVADPASIASFHPLVRSARTTGADGTERECSFIPMGVAVERLRWEGNELIAEMVGGRGMPPIAEMTGRLRLDEAGDETLVSFDLEYRMRPGRLPALMNAAMVRPQFTRAPRYYVAGLKHLVERGCKAATGELKRLGWIPV